METFTIPFNYNIFTGEAKHELAKLLHLNELRHRFSMHEPSEMTINGSTKYDGSMVFTLPFKNECQKDQKMTIVGRFENGIPDGLFTYLLEGREEDITLNTKLFLWFKKGDMMPISVEISYRSIVQVKQVNKNGTRIFFFPYDISEEGSFSSYGEMEYFLCLAILSPNCTELLTVDKKIMLLIKEKDEYIETIFS